MSNCGRRGLNYRGLSTVSIKEIVDFRTECSCWRVRGKVFSALISLCGSWFTKYIY